MSDSSSLPAHLAIIPDGSRRYARAHGQSIPESYSLGLEKVVQTIEWLLAQGVGHVSAYAASGENVARRPKAEIMGVYLALSRFFAALSRIEGVVLHVFGDIQGLPDWVPNKAEMLRLMSYDSRARLVIHFAVNYSGQAERGATLSEGVPAVDLLVRTGGQHRLSGFLPFQTLYSELYFSDKLWPEFSLDNLAESFEWYSQQKRNFGA